MRGLGSGAYAGATADMVAGLLAEFVGDAQERVADLTRRIPKGDGLPELRRFVFDLAGQARNFGLSMLETVADQAQNYLTATTALDDRAIDDLGQYLDVIQDMLNGKQGDEGDIRQMVRGLPVRRGVEIDEAPEVRDIEVVLVMSPGTQQTFVERELRACGYRATAIPDPEGPRLRDQGEAGHDDHLRGDAAAFGHRPSRLLWQSSRRRETSRSRSLPALMPRIRSSRCCRKVSRSSARPAPSATISPRRCSRGSCFSSEA